jgi:hypothetical protein
MVPAMKARLLVCVLAAAACSPSKPGPQANATYFWHVTSSTVSFGSMCSDDQTFRSMNAALTFADNSYIVYTASADDKTAPLQTCTSLDASTCMPAASGVVFDVAGAELSYETQMTTPTGSGKCDQLDTQVWLAEDMVQTLDLKISDTISLVDDDTTCAALQADAVAHSTNMEGYQGCTITFDIGGSSGQ